MDETPHELDVLVGTWTQHVGLEGVGDGTVTYGWTLGGHYLRQKSHSPDPVPDSECLIEPDGEGGYRLHYFDSRGVTRFYTLRLAGRVMTITRMTADFSPLPFAQRYTGHISEDGRTIDGRWEKSHDDGATWELDFTLVYERRG